MAKRPVLLLLGCLAAIPAVASASAGTLLRISTWTPPSHFVNAVIWSKWSEWIANPRTLNKLSTADRKAVMDASGARLSQFAGVQWDTMDRAGRAAAEAAGTTIRLAGSTMKERFFRMMKPVQEAWIERASKAGYNARAALAELRRSARAHDDAR